VRVLQARHRLRLAVEAAPQLRAGCQMAVDGLQRHQAIEPVLARLVDDAHPPLAQHAQDLVPGHRQVAGNGTG
jgi:hypothetical protein